MRDSAIAHSGENAKTEGVSYRLRLIDSDRFRIPKPTRSG
jgi:hypothetical protein